MVVKQQSQKSQQYVCAVIGSIGSLIMGLLMAWSSPSIVFLKSGNNSAPFIMQTEREEEIIAAIMPLGALVGSFFAGFLADLFGRKFTMSIFTLPWIVSWLMTTFAPNVSILYGARFLGGLVGGVFCGILPLYINEIAEDSIRGALGTYFQLFVTFGQLLVVVLSIFESYQILCLACTAVSILLCVSLPFLPESPIYLVKKKRSMEAEKSLRRLRGVHYDVSCEIKDIGEELENLKRPKSSNSASSTVKTKGLMICSVLMIIQQFSGVNAVIFFSNMIFEDAKASSPIICTIVLGGTQSLANFASSFLIERTGRKILLLSSIECMGFSLLALGFYFWMLDNNMNTDAFTWLPLCSIVFFIVSYAWGMGPIPWLISGELLDPEVKSLGATVTATSNLITLTLITFFFNSMIDVFSAAYTFWIFAAVCLVGTIFIIIVVPETRGKSVQEVQLILAGKNSNSLNRELP